MDFRIEYLIDFPQHLEAVATWNNTEWPEYYGGELSRAIEYHRATMTRGSVPCAFVALENDCLVGTVSLLSKDMDLRDDIYSPWLGSLYVDSRYRGCGVARKLIQHCTSEAKAIGVGSLYVWTKELRGLFESCGWESVERIKFHGAFVDVLKTSLTT
jgi:GNAT superfamily N-acetyltransferase